MEKVHSPSWLALLIASTFIGAAGNTPAAELGAVDEPLVLTMAEWTGQHIDTQIVGRILEKAGYKVEYVTAGGFPQFTGLADGSLTASMEIWSNNVGDIYPRVLAEGKIENGGPLGITAREGFLYPKFLEELCPGLPDWTALKNPDCAMALATPDTLPEGRLLDYPADWGSRSGRIIEDNDLPLVAVPAGSEGAMIAELRSAVAAHTPLLMLMWSPHYALTGIDYGWVDMPPCPDNDIDRCIITPEIHKVFWSGTKDKWPAAYEILKAFRLTNDDQQAMSLRIVEGGESLDAVADDWIARNEAIWKPWVEAALH